MMPQMGEPMREQPSSEYGRYEGNQEYSQQYTPSPQYGQPGSTFDDDSLDSLAQRLSQRMNQDAQGKLFTGTPPSSRATAGQKLALAIVSVVMLVPLAAILMAGVGGIAGLISFGAVCLAIFLINAVFNDAHR